MQDYLSIAANGLALGMSLFLAAIGLTVLFGILRILNFAHGSFIMVGAYLAHTMLRSLGSYGPLEFLLVAVAAGLVIGVVGMLLDLFVFRRLHGVDESVALIATFAVMLVVNGVAKLIWGAQYVSVDAPAGLTGALQLGPVMVPAYSAALFVLGLVVFVALELFLHRSWTGKTLRAVADDRWVMGILGHSPRRMELLAVFLAFFLAGFAGGTLVPNQVLTPGLGNHFIIEAFAVVIVGGLGSVRGTLVAAMLLGLAESIGSRVMPSLSLYVCMILILILRPQGLFPGRSAQAPGSWSLRWLFGSGLGQAQRPPPAQAPRPTRSPALPPEVRHAAQARVNVPVLALLALALLLLPTWAGGGLVYVASLALVSAVFAMSWNLMFGFGGVATFGHAAFFAVGAYLCAYLLKLDAAMPFEWVLLAALALGGTLAGIVGMVAIRRANGVQLAILTLALAEVARVLISYSAALGRDEGLSAVPRPTLGWSGFSLSLAGESTYYLFLCVACGLAVWALWMLSHSSFGRTLKSIRQDAQRALFLGINVDRYRWLAFVVAAAVAALAGALATPLSQIVTPEAASVARSTEPMLRTLVGGAASFWGPAVGTFIFATIDYAARGLAGLSEFIMGIALLVIVLVAPGGVMSYVRLPSRAKRSREVATESTLIVKDAS
ncbi:MAG TPA: ABC transporter permease [Ramlibacter sp.]|nr:ABC transporter permease [Ramlibacter sp.]